MRKQQKQILLVVPVGNFYCFALAGTDGDIIIQPYHPRAKFFGPAEYSELYSYVDQFIVMTYDFSAGNRKEYVACAYW